MLESTSCNGVRATYQRDSLRDLIVAIEAHSRKSYHLGFGKSVTRSNLSKANENRDYRILKSFAYYSSELPDKSWKTMILR